MKIQISDDDGIISIVNSDKYQSFVHEDWELEQLKQHFIHQMNNQTIIVWQSNNFGGGFWNIDISEIASSENSFSEFKKTIEVTNNKLYISNYTDLTMAAQFEDEKIPSIYNSDKFIQLENGLYELTIRQMFNPDEDINESSVAFEMIYKKVVISEKIYSDKIYWWTY